MINPSVNATKKARAVAFNAAESSRLFVPIPTCSKAEKLKKKTCN